MSRWRYQHMLTFMRDLHPGTARKLGDERILAIKVCTAALRKRRDIELAQYGTSIPGALRQLYREEAEKSLWRLDANHLRRTYIFVR